MGYYSSKLFYTREYKLQPFVAPDDFDPAAQPVNIYEKFKSLHSEDETAAFIWYYSESSSLNLSSTTGILWRYGQTINGSEVISPKVSSGTVFTSGSTQRWVCGYYTGAETIHLSMMQNWYPRWIYIYSDKITGFKETPNNWNYLNYIHFHNLSNLATLAYANLFTNCAGLTGTLHLPSTVSSIASYGFFGDAAITKVNCYRSIAPGTATYTLDLRGTPRPLHVPVGSSGYNVTPWTDTAIFSSIIADL